MLRQEPTSLTKPNTKSQLLARHHHTAVAMHLSIGALNGKTVCASTVSTGCGLEPHHGTSSSGARIARPSVYISILAMILKYTTLGGRIRRGRPSNVQMLHEE
jgi:hypothetical protein